MARNERKIDPRIVLMMAKDMKAGITEDVIAKAADIAMTNFQGKGNAEVTAILLVLLMTHLRQIPIDLREEAGVAFTGLVKHSLMMDDN